MRAFCRDCGSGFLTTGHVLAETTYCPACTSKHPSKVQRLTKRKRRKAKKAK